MFITDTIIDAVQNGKKQFVNTVFANNESVAKALTGFVDAQTTYTKEAVKAGTNTATTLASEATKAVQEAAKFDFVEAAKKANEQFTKTFSFKK
jgi:hypothetical protein